MFRTSPEPDYDKPYDENRKQSSGTDESQFSDRSEQESYDRSAQRGNLYYNESTGTDQNSTDGYYDWDEEEAFREPDIVEAMRKFQGHQALQSIMYDTVRDHQILRPRVSTYGTGTDHRDSYSEMRDYDSVFAENVPAVPSESDRRGTEPEIAGLVVTEHEVKPLSPEDFRELVQPLAEKRREYHKLKSEVDAIITPTVRQKASRYRKSFTRAIQTVITNLKPFSGLLRWIDSHYGSDVHGYFVFILWIMAVNSAAFAVLFLFGLAPSIVWHDNNDGLPMAVDASRNFQAQDLLSGGGSLQSSIFHYGFYLHDYAIIFRSWTFDRTLGYLLAIAFFYFFNFVVITYYLARSYGQLVTDFATDGKPKYCETVFFMWEFTTTDKAAIHLNRTHLRTTLREKLVTVRRMFNSRRALILKRVAINLASVLLVAGICMGLWYFLRYIKFQSPETDVSNNSALSLAKELSPAIIITALNLALPFAFSRLTQYEEHVTYEMELALSLAKGVLLNFGTLGVLFYFWIFNESGQKIENLEFGSSTCAERVIPCWESALSQKFYQLAVLNVIFEYGFSLIAVVAAWLNRREYSTDSQLTFRADLLTQRIIYLQVLTYFASFYSPMMAAIAIFSIFIMFCRDAIIVRYTKLYKSAPLGSGNEGTQGVYCGALLATFILVGASVAFAITALLPSTECGPLRTLCPNPDIIVATISRIREAVPWLYDILDIFIMPPVLLYVMLVLLVLIYYYSVQNKALAELMPVLQNHLALEEKDIIALYIPMVKQTHAPPPGLGKPPRAKHTQADIRAAKITERRNGRLRSNRNSVEVMPSARSRL